jgi:hypothetical protein
MEKAMKHSTIIKEELPDLLIGVIALLIALMIWGLVLAPAAV